MSDDEKRRAYSRAYREANKVTLRDKARKRYEANRETILKKGRERKAANIEEYRERDREHGRRESTKARRREYMQTYRAENRERLRERRRVWYEKNKDGACVRKSFPCSWRGNCNRSKGRGADCAMHGKYLGPDANERDDFAGQTPISWPA